MLAEQEQRASIPPPSSSPNKMAALTQPEKIGMPVSFAVSRAHTETRTARSFPAHQTKNFRGGFFGENFPDGRRGQACEDPPRPRLIAPAKPLHSPRLHIPPSSRRRDPTFKIPLPKPNDIGGASRRSALSSNEELIARTPSAHFRKKRAKRIQQPRGARSVGPRGRDSSGQSRSQSLLVEEGEEEPGPVIIRGISVEKIEERQRERAAVLTARDEQESAESRLRRKRSEESHTKSRTIDREDCLSSQSFLAMSVGKSLRNWSLPDVPVQLEDPPRSERSGSTTPHRRRRRRVRRKVLEVNQSGGSSVHIPYWDVVGVSPV